MIIVNADDVGRCRAETDVALALFGEGRLTSGTFMMFMEDTERAAARAREAGFPAGLHLNLSQPYNGRAPAGAAGRAHDQVVRFMTATKYAVLLYHPGLRAAFRDVFRSQAEEFERQFDRPPRHVDGHQHRHLCANLLWAEVIPAGCSVRRNFSFFPGEKGWINRRYRAWMDGRLGRRYRLADYFFSLTRCLKGQGLEGVTGLAREHTVEVMTHPVLEEEAAFLRGDKWGGALNQLERGHYGMI